MKKTYQKPLVGVEQFDQPMLLTACTGYTDDSTLGKPSLSSKNTCGWDVGADGDILWVSSGSICTVPMGEDGEFSGVCYNNPSGGMSIFSRS